jgi:hypothetical protein
MICIKLSVTMRDKFKLIGITVLFVLTGLVLSYFALQDSEFKTLDYCLVDEIRYEVGENIENYQEDYICSCGSEGLVECIPVEPTISESVEDDFLFDTSELETKGLEFEYNYLTGFTEEEQFINLSPVKFTKIAIDEKSLSVVLEQMQICSDTNMASEQVGFYKRDGSKLKLYNMVKPLGSTESLACTVQLKYILEDFDDLEKMEIAFVDSEGVVTDAKMCVFNGNVYSDNDVFMDADGSLCTCYDGEVNCEELSD